MGEITRKDIEKYHVYRFLSYCMDLRADDNEYPIACAIMDHFHSILEVSIEQIAEEANISKASVSRFVRKAGFDSFSGMKIAVSVYAGELQLARRKVQEKVFNGYKDEDICKFIFDNAVTNMENTLKILDVDILRDLAKQILSRKRVVIAGDRHELAIFKTVQMDMIALGISARMYNEDEVALRDIAELSKEDMLIVLTLDEKFTMPSKYELLKTAGERKVKRIVFAQNEKLVSAECETYVRYGKDGTYNDGYYSLFLAAQMLSEFLYRQ